MARKKNAVPPKRPGRKPGPPELLRCSAVSVACTETEHDQIHEAAAAHQMRAAPLVRKIVRYALENEDVLEAAVAGGAEAG